MHDHRRIGLGMAAEKSELEAPGNAAFVTSRDHFTRRRDDAVVPYRPPLTRRERTRILIAHTLWRDRASRTSSKSQNGRFTLRHSPASCLNSAAGPKNRPTIISKTGCGTRVLGVGFLTIIPVTRQPLSYCRMTCATVCKECPGSGFASAFVRQST